jgi:hypothetical protein
MLASDVCVTVRLPLRVAAAPAEHRDAEEAGQHPLGYGGVGVAAAP